MRARPIGSLPAGCDRTSVSPHTSSTASVRCRRSLLAAAARWESHQVGRQAPTTAAPLERDEHVLLDRQRSEHLLALERAPDAVPGPPCCAPARDIVALIEDATRRWGTNTGQYVEERGLPRAVRADETEYLSGERVDGHAGKRGDTAETDEHIDGAKGEITTHHRAAVDSFGDPHISPPTRIIHLFYAIRTWSSPT